MKFSGASPKNQKEFSDAGRRIKRRRCREVIPVAGGQYEKGLFHQLQDTIDRLERVENDLWSFPAERVSGTVRVLWVHRPSLCQEGSFNHTLPGASSCIQRSPDRTALQQPQRHPPVKTGRNSQATRLATAKSALDRSCCDAADNVFLHQNKEHKAGNHRHHDTGQCVFPV